MATHEPPYPEWDKVADDKTRWELQKIILEVRNLRRAWLATFLASLALIVQWAGCSIQTQLSKIDAEKAKFESDKGKYEVEVAKRQKEELAMESADIKREVDGIIAEIKIAETQASKLQASMQNLIASVEKTSLSDTQKASIIEDAEKVKSQAAEINKNRLERLVQGLFDPTLKVRSSSLRILDNLHVSNPEAVILVIQSSMLNTENMDGLANALEYLRKANRSAVQPRLAMVNALLNKIENSPGYENASNVKLKVKMIRDRQVRWESL